MTAEKKIAIPIIVKSGMKQSDLIICPDYAKAPLKAIVKDDGGDFPPNELQWLHIADDGISWKWTTDCAEAKLWNRGVNYDGDKKDDPYYWADYLNYKHKPISLFDLVNNGIRERAEIVDVCSLRAAFPLKLSSLKSLEKCAKWLGLSYSIHCGFYGKADMTAAEYEDFAAIANALLMLKAAKESA